MRYSLRMTLIPFGLVLALCCTPSNRSPESNTAADVEAIRAVLADAVRASEAGDADAYIKYITDDALILAPGQPPIEGKATIHSWITVFFADYEFSLPQWTTNEVIVRGDIAIHRFSGVATLTSKKDGNAFVADRKYMDVLRKEADGQWRIARHMLNLNR